MFRDGWMNFVIFLRTLEIDKSWQILHSKDSQSDCRFTRQQKEPSRFFARDNLACKDYKKSHMSALSRASKEIDLLP